MVELIQLIEVRLLYPQLYTASRAAACLSLFLEWGCYLPTSGGVPLSASCSDDELGCDVHMVGLVVVGRFVGDFGEDGTEDVAMDKSIISSPISVPEAFVGHRTCWHQ